MLIEYRCPACNRVLFHASGVAVIAAHCPRCHAVATALTTGPTGAWMPASVALEAPQGVTGYRLSN